MKLQYLSLIMLTMTIFLGFGLQPAHADDTNGISIQNVKVQPSTIKVGDTFTVTATLVNNSTVPIVLEGGTCVPLIEHVPFFTVMLDSHTKIKSKNLTCAGVGLSQILNLGKKLTGTSPDSTLAYIATESGTANITVTFSYHVANQTDPTKPNIEQTISKSFLFTIYDNKTSIQTSPRGGPSFIFDKITPLKQFKSGIRAEDVKCSIDHVLTINSEDCSPACVKTETAKILYERGWALVLTINLGTNMTSNQPVEIVSIQLIPSLTNPGGPPIKLTLMNIGMTPITSLKAILALNNDYDFDFKNVTQSKPLVHGSSISETRMLIGAGFRTELAYPITISGITNNVPFTYTENVHMP